MGRSLQPTVSLVFEGLARRIVSRGVRQSNQILCNSSSREVLRSIASTPHYHVSSIWVGVNLTIWPPVPKCHFMRVCPSKRERESRPSVINPRFNRICPTGIFSKRPIEIIRTSRRGENKRENEQSGPQTPRSHTNRQKTDVFLFLAKNGAVICETCTQQALTYQQLIAYLDPSGASESVLTLAAVLQACPHQKQED